MCPSSIRRPVLMTPPPPCQSSSCPATGAERRGVENQQHEGHRGLSSSLVLSDLLMLDLVVAGLQGERYLSDLKVLKRLQTKQRELHVRYLEGGEHNAVFSVLDAGVHQVFDQTDLRTKVPDTEERKKKKKSQPLSQICSLLVMSSFSYCTKAVTLKESTMRCHMWT